MFGAIFTEDKVLSMLSIAFTYFVMSFPVGFAFLAIFICYGSENPTDKKGKSKTEKRRIDDEV